MDAQAQALLELMRRWIGQNPDDWLDTVRSGMGEPQQLEPTEASLVSVAVVEDRGDEIEVEAEVDVTGKWDDGGPGEANVRLPLRIDLIDQRIVGVEPA